MTSLVCVQYFTPLTQATWKRRFNGLQISFGIQKTRMPKHTGFNLGWLMGLEPTTTGITIRGSTNWATATIKLFGAPDRNRTCNRPLRRRVLYPVELRALYLSCRSQFFGELWSGRWDSNSRPSAPKADALTRLRYAPIRKANSTHTAFTLSSR